MEPMTNLAKARPHPSIAETVAVIIARSGSKGLPGKNELIVAGRPMVEHTILDALESKQVDGILVSTDSSAIGSIASRCGVQVVHRPAELAADTATIDSAVRHAITNAAPAAREIVILYGNVPFRPTTLIDEAICRRRTTAADSVQSYSPVGKMHPWWMVGMDEQGRVSKLHDNTVYRRQDLPECFIPDGGVIVVTRQSLECVIEDDPHAFLGQDRRGIVTSQRAVVDVDDRIDAALAEVLLREQGSSADVQSGGL